MDVPIKVGDSTSNGFREIRDADFVSNERTLAQVYPNSAKRKAFRLIKTKTTAPTFDLLCIHYGLLVLVLYLRTNVRIEHFIA